MKRKYEEEYMTDEKGNVYYRESPRHFWTLYSEFWKKEKNT